MKLIDARGVFVPEKVEYSARTRTVRSMDFSNTESEIVVPTAGKPDQRMAAHRADDPSVTVQSGGMLVAAVPLFFGFRPEDSMVILGLRSAPDAARPVRICCAFRLDLADIAQESASVRDVVDRLQRYGAEQVLLIAFGLQAGAEGRDPGPERCRAAVDGLGERIRDAGHLPVIDAMYVANGRWWSYLCSSVCCWPEVGSPVPAEPPAALRAVPEFRNATVADSRRELEQSLQPYGEDQAGAMAAALASASVTSASGLDVDAARQLAEAVLARCDTDSVDVRDEEAAALLVSLRHPDVRDHLAITAADVDGAGRLQVLATELARRAPSGEYQPAPYTLAAWAAWALGRTALARCAVARALAADPNYTFATLIASGLQHGIAPAHIRKSAARTRAELNADAAQEDTVAANPSQRS